MKDIRKYLITTFSLTYVLWGSIALYTQINDKPFNTSLVMLILYVLGVISPAISGILVKKQSLSKEKYRVFLKNIISPPKRLIWYIIFITVVIVFKVFPFLIFGGERSSALYMVILQLPLYILIGGLEEIGWRGLLLGELQKNMSVFTSTVITGIIWIAWHLPLFFIVGTYQEQYSGFLTFALNTLGFAFILSAVFLNTKSIFMCIFCHALLNSVSGVFIVNETFFSSSLTLFIGIIVFFGFQLYHKKNNAL